MSNQRRKVWDNGYICLYSNRTCDVADGIRYPITLDVKEVQELYFELKKLFEGENNNE